MRPSALYKISESLTPKADVIHIDTVTAEALKNTGRLDMAVIGEYQKGRWHFEKSFSMKNPTGDPNFDVYTFYRGPSRDPHGNYIADHATGIHFYREQINNKDFRFTVKEQLRQEVAGPLYRINSHIQPLSRVNAGHAQGGVASDLSQLEI